MIDKFLMNVLNMGFLNIILYGFVLILVHQSIALLLANIEKMLKMPVQFYWYDIPITLFFIFIFVYGIYNYKGN